MFACLTRLIAATILLALLNMTIAIGEDPLSGADPFGGGKATPTGVKRMGVPKPNDKTRASGPFKQIEAELNCTTSVTLEKVTLPEAMRAISRAHDIPIVIDRQSLSANGIDPNVLVTAHLKGVKLRSVLILMFRGVGLDYVIKDEVLQIKTKGGVEAEPIIVVYVLDSYDERSDDLASAIQKSLDAIHTASMPKPVVQLVRNVNPDVKRFNILVEANKSMHVQAQRILDAFAKHTGR